MYIFQALPEKQGTASRRDCFCSCIAMSGTGGDMARTAAVGKEVGGGACAVAKIAGEGMSGNRALHEYLNRLSH